MHSCIVFRNTSSHNIAGLTFVWSYSSCWSNWMHDGEYRKGVGGN